MYRVFKFKITMETFANASQLMLTYLGSVHLHNACQSLCYHICFCFPWHFHFTVAQLMLTSSNIEIWNFSSLSSNSLKGFGIVTLSCISECYSYRDDFIIGFLNLNSSIRLNSIYIHKVIFLLQRKTKENKEVENFLCNHIYWREIYTHTYIFLVGFPFSFVLCVSILLKEIMLILLICHRTVVYSLVFLSTIVVAFCLRQIL